MKKIYQIIILCAMGVILSSCDSESSTRSKMEQACENHEFLKAYELASELYGSDIDYVVKKETAYIIESQGDAGLGRISVILNEHKDIAADVYLDLLKMAIMMDNESLATKLYKMSDVSDEQTIDYAIASDMENLVSVFLNKNPEYIDKQNVIDYLTEKGIYNDYKTKCVASKFTKLFAKASAVIIPTPPALGNTDFNGSGSNDEYYFKKQIKEYSACVESKNKICLEIIQLAIENKDKNQAQRALDMMIADRVIKSNRWVTNSVQRYTVVLNNASIAEAKELMKKSKF